MAKTRKKPVVRPGQRVPYRRGTQAQIDERRGYIAGLMARGLPKMIIHALVRTRFNRQWRTTDRDIDEIGSCGHNWLLRSRGGRPPKSISELREMIQSLTFTRD